MPNQLEKSSQTEPQSAHAQSVDPAALPDAATGGSQARLQDILPEIHQLAARVGGLKRLAEIIAALEPSKE